MQYYVFRIHPGFHHLIDTSLLANLLDREHDAFYHLQMQRIIKPIMWPRLLYVARRYFQGREDIIINDFRIAWKPFGKDLYDELIPMDQGLRLEMQADESPLRTFLAEINDPLVLIASDELPQGRVVN